LLYARALEAQGKTDEAIAEYRRLVPYFSGEEARARFAMLLDKTGARDEARAIYQEIVKLLDGAPARYRQAQKEWGDIARRGLK
ncbi:MAG: tetratricopeptide repeat protein, partial [Rhizomicrobium sp.]